MGGGSILQSSKRKLSSGTINALQKVLPKTLDEFVRSFLPKTVPQNELDRLLSEYDKSQTLLVTSIDTLERILPKLYTLLEKLPADKENLEAFKQHFDPFLKQLFLNSLNEYFKNNSVMANCILASNGSKLPLPVFLKEMLLMLEHNEGVLEKPINDPDVQLYYFLLSRLTILQASSYPRTEKEELPDEIGVTLGAFGEDDFSSYILVGTAQNPTIYIANELADRLKESGKFQDPGSYDTLEPSIVEQILAYAHPDINAALKACHDNNTLEKAQAAAEISDETIKELQHLSVVLWNSSTDSGRLWFDEKSANKAMQHWAGYANTDEKRSDLEKLRALSYSLSIRSNTITSFDAIFGEATYKNCAGQLGLTAKQWVSAFLADIGLLKSGVIGSGLKNRKTIYSNMLAQSHKCANCAPKTVSVQTMARHHKQSIFDVFLHLKLLNDTDLIALFLKNALVLHHIADYCHSVKIYVSLHYVIQTAMDSSEGRKQLLNVIASKGHNGLTGLQIVAWHTPDLLPDLLMILKEESSGSEKLADAIVLQNDIGWSGLQAVVRHAHQSLPALLEILRKTLPGRNKLADAIVLLNNGRWSGLQVVAKHARQSLPAVLDILEIAEYGREKLAHAIALPNNDRLSGLLMVLMCAPQSAPQIFDILKKAPSGRDKLADAIVLQNDAGWSGLQEVVTCDSHQPFLTILTILKNTEYGREKLADAIALQNNFGWSGLQMVAKHAPQSLPALLKILKNAPSGREKLAVAIALHDNDNTSGLGMVVKYAAQSLPALLDILESTPSGPEKLANVFAFHSRSRLEGIEPSSLFKILNIAIKRDNYNLYVSICAYEGLRMSINYFTKHEYSIQDVITLATFILKDPEYAIITKKDLKIMTDYITEQKNKGPHNVTADTSKLSNITVDKTRPCSISRLFITPVSRATFKTELLDAVTGTTPQAQLPRRHL